MNVLYLFIALVICVTVHEAAHAWTAWKLGDPTAKAEGRVSLNPLRHLDPLGTIMVFIAQFGWGKPTPFNYHNLKHPRRDAALISIAGPISNLLTALLIAIIFKYAGVLPAVVAEALLVTFQLSIVLFLFNLLPIAPLDGSKLLGLVIPASMEDWYQRFLIQGPVFLILLIIGDRILHSLTGFSFFGVFLQFGFDITHTLIFLAT